MNRTVFEMHDCYGVDEKSDSKCVICYAKQSDTIVLPCRHMTLCQACSQVVRSQNNRCPICRTLVQAFV